MGYNLIVKTIVRNTLDWLKCEKMALLIRDFQDITSLLFANRIFVSLDIIPFLKIIINNRRANINAVTEESTVADGVREA